MADRSVKIIVSAAVDGLVAGMRTAARATEDYSKKAIGYVQKNEQAINDLANSMGKIGLVTTGIAALAVKKWADFDSAMSAVAATGEDARQNIQALTQASIEGGAASVFTATEAAQAVEALAKAGVSSADILDGGLTGALDLAAAGEIGLAEAAEIAATAMNQFGLTGADTSHIADVLAASAGKAMGDVTDMANALKFVGPVASQMGISLEETAGSIAFLAQQGVLGEQAGTSLRGILSSLTSPSQIAAKTMESLGINVYDASGEFVGLAGVAGQLKDRLGDLTDAERNQAFGRIFGNEQITTARLLYQGGSEAVREWTAAVDDSGYAGVTAATKLDNLKGDFEALMGSIESAMIGMGAGTDGALRQMVQSVTGLVDSFNELPGPIKSALLILVGGGGLVALGVAGMAKLIIGVGNTKNAMTELGVSAKRTSLLAGGIGTAFALGATALVAWGGAVAARRAEVEALADSFDRATGAASELTEQMVIDELSKPKSGPFGVGTVSASALDQAERIGLALDTVKDAAMGSEAALGIVRERLAELKGMSPTEFREETERLNVSTEDLAEAESYLGDMVNDTGDKFGEATRIAKQKREADGEAAEAATGLGDASVAAGEGTEALAEGLDSTSIAAAEAEKALQQAREEAGKLGESFFDAGEALEGSMEAWRAQLDKQAQALKDFRKNSVEAMRKGADETLVDYLVEQGPAGAAMLEQLANATDSNVKRINDSWRDGRKEIELFQDAQTQIRPEVVTQFKVKGEKGAIRTAIDVANRYGLTPEEVETYMRALDFSSKDIRKVQERLDSLDGTTATPEIDAETATAQSAVNSFITLWDSINPFKTVTINTVRTGDDAGKSARAPKVKKAAGGSIVGPGTGTSDDVLMWGSNGEHMWTADEVQKAGGQGAMYAMRAAVRSGVLPAFASGGAVSRLDVMNQQRTVRDIERSLREREEYGKKEKGKKRKKRLVLKPGSLDRRIAMAELAEAKAELRDLRSDAASRTERAEARAEARRKRVEDATGTRDSVMSSLQGGFGVDQFTGKNEYGVYGNITGTAIASGAKAYAAKVKSFASKFEKARKLGIPIRMLQEIAGLGVDEGLQALDALLSSSSSDISTIQAAYRDIDTYGKGAGEVLAKALDLQSQGRSSAEGWAKGFIVGLNDQASAVKKAKDNATNGKKTPVSTPGVVSGSHGPYRGPAVTGSPFAYTTTRVAAAQTGAATVVLDYDALAIALAKQPQEVVVNATLQASGRQLGTLVQIGEQAKEQRL